MKTLEECQQVCEAIKGLKAPNGSDRFSEASFWLSFDGNMWKCEYLVQKIGFGKQAGGFRHLSSDACITHIWQRLIGVYRS